MPIITGSILKGGPVADVLVGVSLARRRLLEKHSMPVPHDVHVRVLIDTGSSHSGFAPRVFNELRLAPVAKMPLITPSTLPDAPYECDIYDVLLSLVANGSAHLFGRSQVMGTDCWMEDEGMEGLIGRDILDHCTFQYFGKDRNFVLAF